LTQEKRLGLFKNARASLHWAPLRYVLHPHIKRKTRKLLGWLQLGESEKVQKITGSDRGLGSTA